MQTDTLADMTRERNELRAEVRRLRAALQEISIGRGPFSRDPLTHADNTIEAMKGVATQALASTWEVSDD